MQSNDRLPHEVIIDQINSACEQYEIAGLKKSVADCKRLVAEIHTKINLSQFSLQEKTTVKQKLDPNISLIATIEVIENEFLNQSRKYHSGIRGLFRKVVVLLNKNRNKCYQYPSLLGLILKDAYGKYSRILIPKPAVLAMVEKLKKRN